MSVWHLLAHMLGWNRGTVVSARRPDGVLWMGFRCSKCGWVTNKHTTLAHLLASDPMPPQDKDFHA